MADAIRIQVTLDPTGITQAGQQIARQLQSALDSSANSAKAAGKKIGDALSAGIEEGLRKAASVRKQFEQSFSPGSRHTIEQAAEVKHQQRLTEIRERAAAQQATIRARDEANAAASARRIAEAQEKAFRRPQGVSDSLTFFKRYSSTIREAGESIQQFGVGLLGVTAGIISFGRGAVTSAINIDRQVNVLKSLTGSAEAAEKRYAALIALSAKTPGLTTSLAATLDAQLRVANVTEATINRILPAIGKLNAVSPLGDPARFASNLVQLVSQNFERADLKELVGASPLAGEIIKELFKVDNPTNAKAIRESAAKLGLNSTEAFFAAFSDAANKNAKLVGVTESLGTQFEKLRDRVLVAFRPLGLAIIQALAPLVEKAVPIIEQLSQAFRALPETAQQAIIVLGLLAAAIGPLVIALGGLIQAFGALGNIITVFAGIGGTAGLAGAFSGLLPTITAIGAAIGPVGIAIGALALVIGGTVAAISLFGKTTAEAAAATRESLVASQQRVQAGQLEVNTLRNLQEQTSLNAAEQAKIKQLYDALDPVQKARVGVYAEESGGVDTLTGKLAGLVQVLDEVNQKRRESQTIQSVQAGADLVNQVNINGLRDFGDEITSLNTKIEEYARKQVEAEQTGERFGRSLAGPGVAAADVYAQRIRELSGQLSKTRDLSERNKQTYNELGKSIREAAKASGIAAEQFIRQAIAASGLKGDLSSLERQLRLLAGLSTSRSAPSRSSLLAGEGARPAEEALTPRPGRTGGGDGSGSGESKARALREALLQQQRTFLEQNQRLLEDANKRELESFKELYDNKTITAREFFDNKTRIEQGTLRGSIATTEQEISAAENAIARLKPGTVERIRLEGELFKLRTDLQIKSREFYFSEIENIQATTKVLLSQRETLLADLNKFAVKVDESQLPSARIAESVDPFTQRARDAVLKAQQATIQFRKDDIALQLQEVQIQNAVNAGVLTERQGKEATLAVQRQYRDVLIQSLELQKAGLDPEAIARINVQIEQLRNLGLELTPAQAFFKGLRSEAETTAEAFERIGTALKDKFLNTLDSGIDRLTKKFGFFKDLIGDILKSLTRRIVSQLFGGGGGGFGGQQSGGGGGGIGGFLGNLFGGLFGRNQQAQQGGNLANVGSLFSGGGQNFGSFLTGGFAGGNPAQSILGGGSGGGFNLASLLGGGIFAPPSISSGTGVFAGIPSGASSAGPNLGGLGNLGLLGNLKNLFSGIGFGKGAGTGGALASALPLLGLTLGASVGGSSVLGQILGGAGGLAVGVGLTAAPASLAGSFLAPLFSNPITAIIGGALLVGAFFLGRAAARKRDEKTSGDYLQQAIDSIREIGDGVRNDSIKGSDAKKLFESEVMATFIAQINTIKTKSVRESRLTNQTRDLRALFEKEVGPEIEAQKLRIKSGAFGRNLIPEFATGGVVGGVDLGRDSVMALLRPREMVLTIDQQMRIAQMAGRNVFAVAGVPGAGLAQQPTSSPVQPFITGGVVSPFIASNTSNDAPIEITVVINNGMTEEEATTILEKSVRGSRGRNVIVQTVRKEKSFGN